MIRALAVCLTALSLLVPGTGVSAVEPEAPAESSPADTVQVRFPSITRFNPTVTDYVVHVEDLAPGTGTLHVSTSEGGTVQVTQPGDVVAPFGPWSGSDDMYVTVRRCNWMGCATLATSPPLAVWAELGANVAGPSVAGPGPHAWTVTSGLPAGESASLTWRLVDAAGTVLQTGDRLVSGVPVEVDVTLDPTVLRQGERYVVRVDLTADTAEFGPLVASRETSFRYDADADRDIRVTPLRDLYPVQDGYRDRSYFEVRLLGRGIRHVAVDVVDARGRTVRVLKRSSASERLETSRLRLWWDGRTGAGRPVPAGRYQVRVRGEDPAGNQADVRTPVRVLDGELAWKTWRRKVRPSDSELDRAVGTCSRLRPLRGGGFGYYSETRCAKPGQGTVATVHGVYLPTAIERGYRNYRVTVHGGAASGRRDAYLVLGYIDSDGDFRARAQMDGRRGAHPGKLTSDKSLIRDLSSRPYVAWQVGLSEGSRFDVRSFTVQMDVQVLRK